MKRLAIKLNDQGDTIVEVLIAIAIVSSVLAGAFTVTQKSTLAVRDSQERGEALQLLQGQLEQVRSVAVKAKNTSDPIFSTSPQYFCMNTTTNQRVNSNNATFDSTCKDMGDTDLYDVTISYDSTNNVFNLTNKWDGMDGGQNQVQLAYKVFPLGN